MASLSYIFLEQGAYLLDRLSDGAFKRGALGIKPGASSKTEPTAPPLSMQRRFAARTLMHEGHACYIVSPKTAQPALVTRKILFLHGGGGMAAPTELHFNFASRLVEKTDAELWFARYPLAPPTNVLDALSWLEALHERILEGADPSQVSFVGDSAGANLVLTLCGRLAQEKRPSKLVAISPAGGLDSSKWFEEREKIAPLDPILPLEICDLVCEYWGRGVDLNSPDIEPLAVDYQGFPPALVTYGTHEIFAYSVPHLVERMCSAGVELELICGDGLCHDYPLAWFVPEALEVLQRIADFLNS